VKHLNVFYFYRLGTYVHDLKITEAGIIATPEIVGLMVHGADALKEFYESLDDEDQIRFHSSIQTAKTVESLVRDYIRQVTDASKPGAPPMAFTAETEDATKSAVRRFETILNKELNDLPVFCVAEKGNYSLPQLIKGASGGYAAHAQRLMDSFMKREIDAGGKCLAFSLPTASGFHTLRAVEIGIKGLLVAMTGSLPKLSNRNWGEYILQLTNAKAPSDLVDLLRILKTKRNPLMHPQDELEPEDAIGIFCICQNVIETITRDVSAKNLDQKFTEALALLHPERHVA
jgi:hypothetical protein